MLITDENILECFSEHLTWATEIDIAHRLGYEQ